MRDKARTHIFFVDDEPKVCKVVAKTLERIGSKVSCFSGATDCLKQLRHKNCDLLVTDVKMPEMDGIELLIQAKKIAPWIPAIVITGYGDIPMAVKALKAGAVEKPLNRHIFISTVETALKRSSIADRRLGKPLTKTEKKVLQMVLNGMSNREIASNQHRSIRTIESHRNRIMYKVGAENLVELVKRAAKMGLI
jgi:FixJ family two-component response regulator